MYPNISCSIVEVEICFNLMFTRILTRPFRQSRNMCILFVYNGAEDIKSDYSLILISNRDEFYNRRTKSMDLWSLNPVTVGGRDLEVEDAGTWLAVSPTHKKIGVLLNLLGIKLENTNINSRGKIVADYVKSNEPVQNYVDSLKTDTKKYNGFVFIAVEFGDSTPAIYSYSNWTDQLQLHNETYLGFGNCLPQAPLKKVEAGREQLADVCKRFNKATDEKELVENLIALLKSEKRHLPDPQLETTRPKLFEQLSSVYVCIPQERYGTRTHTIVLLNKCGILTITEITQTMPIDPTTPQWETKTFSYNIYK